MSRHKFIIGDVIAALKTLLDKSVHVCVTSPPYYGLRSYTKGKNKDEIGTEKTPQEYVQKLVEIGREVKRVLRDDGIFFLNLGDSYASSPVGNFTVGSEILKGRDLTGHIQSGSFNKLKASGLKSKNLLGVPWRVAFALQEDGWYLRNDNIWAKDNCMPFPAMDRFVNTHEYVFLLSKSGDSLFWTHRNGKPGTRIQPKPDYVWDDRKNSVELTEEPTNWKTEVIDGVFEKNGKPKKRYKRNNLWGGNDYYFDWFAVSEPVKITTIQRATRGRGSPTNKYLIAEDFGQNKQGIHSQVTPHSKEKIPARFGIKEDDEFGGIAFGGKKYPDEVGGIYSGCGYELISRRRKRDVWRFATASFSGSHYAVYPTEIPTVAIQAGTSDHGCCPECGAAYIRQLSKSEADEEWKAACGADANGEYHGEALKEYEEHGCQDPSDLKRRILEGMKMIKTIGWEPSCACGRTDTIPCTVLDIFVGSGTTSEVAKGMNRNSIGIDLDPNNIPIQKKRMGFVDGQNRLVEDCEWIIL